jgi:hypothetical protein
VHTPFLAKTSTPSELVGPAPLSVQLPDQVAWPLAAMMVVESGGPDAEHWPTFWLTFWTLLQLKGGVVTLPVPMMLRDTVTCAGVLGPRRDS